MISFVYTLILSGIAAGFSKGIEVIQPAFMVAKAQDAAHFMCEYKHIGDAKQLQITLYKQIGNDSINICDSFVVIEHETPSTTAHEKLMKEDTLCQVHPGQKQVNVSLLDLKPTDAGLYICKIERIYPPPYIVAEGSGIQLYVIETDPCPDIHLNPWVIVAITSGLLGYSILISIYVVKKLLWKSIYFTPGIYEKIIPV